MSVTQSNRYFDHGNIQMFGITSINSDKYLIANCSILKTIPFYSHIRNMHITDVLIETSTFFSLLSVNPLL